MTIPFGRHRLILSVTVKSIAERSLAAWIPVGADDHELALLSRRDAYDTECARWHALTLIYGGAMQP